MNVSILCPTRLRPDRLRRSLLSLYALSDAWKDVEVLLAADLDDPTDYEQFDVRSVTRVERMGYPRIHEYYNLLAAQARGDWLLLWNDDAVMETAGWDEIIASYPQKHVLSPHSHHDPLTTFPVVPRSWVDACGHYAQILHADTWWQDLGNKLGIVEWIEVYIDHQRFDKPGFETEPDVVAQQRDFQLHRFYQPPMQQAHDRDVETVRSLIG